MIRLNMGCGLDYREGDEWVNVDFNTGVQADVYINFNDPLPFDDDTINYILLDNVLEHINPGEYFGFLEELHRICKSGAIIDVYVPHYSGMYALKHATHYKFFGVGSFDIFRPEDCFNGERYSNARFNLAKEELLFFHHKLASMRWLTKLPINWFLNFSRNWQLATEKFHLWAPDEIHYWLEVVK